MVFVASFLQGLCMLAVLLGVSAQNCAPSRRGVSETDINEILNAHNKVRQLVANGQQANQPSASNMNELTWNWDLASAAQRLADSCTFAHDHPTVAGFGYVGQNLYKSSASGVGSDNNNPDWTTAVQSLHDEVNKFNGNGVSNYQFDYKTGHYTQLVWAETKQVGCGYTFYRQGNEYSKLYVCNYGPGGNVISQPMYQQGNACSQCNSCSSSYPGLCSS